MCYQTAALDQLEDLVPQVDWQTGLNVWSHFTDFPDTVSSLPVDSKPELVSIHPSISLTSESIAIDSQGFLYLYKYNMMYYSYLFSFVSSSFQS